MLSLLFLLCHSTLFADGQCTVSGCKDQATEYNSILEVYDKKLELLVRSMSSRIIADVEKLFANGFQQMKEYSVALSRDTFDLKLHDVYDCSDISATEFNGSGVYRVYVNQQQKTYRFDAYCDMNTANGKWLVFQRRKDGSQNFTRGWADYTTGFGDPNGEFWLGNEFLYLLTSKRKYKLRIELENWTGEKRYAEYSNFSISSSGDKYRLVAGGYSGTAGDGLRYHNGQRFSTYDNDYDDDFGSCAVLRRGGWWYNKCQTDCATEGEGEWWNKFCANAHLNGLYYFGGNYSDPYARGIEWYHWYNRCYYSFKTTEMKISPIA